MNHAIRHQSEQVIQEVRREFRPFIEEDINPAAHDRHQQRIPIPKASFLKAAELGLIAYKFPTALGGRGKDHLDWGLLLEEIGYLCDDNSFPMLLSYYTGVAEDIYNIGNEGLIDAYVKPMLKGEKLGVFAYSEDADHFSFQSTAWKETGGYILNGQKPFISGAEIADVFMTYIPDEDGELLVFLIDKNDDGIEIEPRDVFGFKSGGICQLTMRDVKVPFERVIVEQDGLSHGQRYLNTRRVFLACGFLGKMRAIIERCVAMVSKTIRYGKPVTEYPNVQAAIGKMTILYETARACIYRSLEHMISGRADSHFDMTFTIAKYVVADHGKALIDIAMRIVGGRGYLEESRYSRDLADFSALITGAGTQDLLEVNLGVLTTNDVLMRGRSAK